MAKTELLPCPTCNTSEYLKVFNCGYSSFNPVGVKCTACGRKWERYGDYDESDERISGWFNLNRLNDKDRLAEIRRKLEAIICTEGCDRGVIMVSNEATFHDEFCESVGRPVSTYDNENFTPLGDALIELYELTSDPK